MTTALGFATRAAFALLATAALVTTTIATASGSTAATIATTATTESQALVIATNQHQGHQAEESGHAQGNNTIHSKNLHKKTEL